MGETAAGVTDLLLGAAFVAGAGWLARTAGVHRFWLLVFGTAGAGTWAGAVHHLLRPGDQLSWDVAGVLVAAAISALLAASAAELLDRRPARLLAGMSLAGLLLYLAATAAGVGGTTALVVSESVTMAAIVALWISAGIARRPGAGRMLVGIGVCALSAVFYALPDVAGLDARSLQHLGQIPGVLLVAQAVAGRRPSPTGTSPAPALADPRCR